MSTVSVRYFVADVDAAIVFYTQHLGFSVAVRPAPSFAILARGDLRLLLNATGGPGAPLSRCRMDANLSLAVGTAFSSKSRIW